MPLWNFYSDLIRKIQFRRTKMVHKQTFSSLSATLERLKHCGETITEFEVEWGITIDLCKVKRTPSVPEQVKISVYPSESTFGVLLLTLDVKNQLMSKECGASVCAGFVALKENGQDIVDFGFQRGQITRDSRCRDGILRTMAACYIA